MSFPRPRDARPRGLGWRVVGSLPDADQVRFIGIAFARPFFFVVAINVLAAAIFGGYEPMAKAAIWLSSMAVGLLLLIWIAVFASNFLWGQGSR